MQATFDIDNWRYVPSELNPADNLSRGLEVKDIEKWIKGPEFLKLSRDQWPEVVQKVHAESIEFKKVKAIYSISKVEPFCDSGRFSSWTRLVRVTAYCYRFVNNCRQKRSIFTGTKALNPDEVKRAEAYWFRIAQIDLNDWKGNCRDLSPFVEDDLVRVGGRLRKSPLDYDQIHPILLPSSHPISTLFLRHVHERMGHVGPERTLCESRREVWIVRGRNVTRKIVKQCVVCKKLRQPTHTTLMADLPSDRLKLFAPPFSVTGVDLFGPFLLKYGRNKTSKAWGALFTCATVRAIHLEIVDGLSTSAFLHALRRFASHHGWPTTINSDNGTCFVGAEKELRKLYEEGSSQIQDFSSSHKVTWKFNTPLSPHQGGIFESMIKQTKTAIKVSIGHQCLTWNEMATVFAETEALINSRPIGHIPNSPNDLQPLTPNHFLIGRASTVIPQGPFQETKNLHKRFEFVQSLVHTFWKRFIRENVPTLIRRGKWQSKGRQLSVGDIVLISDHTAPRGKWNLARVIEVYPGDDGIIRNVKVKTQFDEYKRSVQRCCPILEL